VPTKTAKKDKTIEKCLVQVSTGEGKSIVLAGLSAYLALIGF
jgi:phage terminase large subunit-like protein